MITEFPLSPEESRMLQYLLSIRRDHPRDDEAVVSVLRMKITLCLNGQRAADGKYRLPLELSTWRMLQKVIRASVSDPQLFLGAEWEASLRVLATRLKDAELAVIVSDSI